MGPAPGSGVNAALLRSVARRCFGPIARACRSVKLRKKTASGAAGYRCNTSLTYNFCVYNIIETPVFSADARGIWTEGERGEFCAWLAANPEAGDVIPGSGGCRKVRWVRAGVGKRGGVRVIYFNRLEIGVIHLLVIYAKAVRGSIPAHLLKAIKQEIENVYNQA